MIATRDRSLLESPATAHRTAFFGRLSGQPASRRRVHLLYADLSSLASVRDFAAELRARFPAIDCLVCNAGVMAARCHQLTTDGYELHFGVNHLGRESEVL